MTNQYDDLPDELEAALNIGNEEPAQEANQADVHGHVRPAERARTTQSVMKLRMEVNVVWVLKTTKILSQAIRSKFMIEKKNLNQCNNF